MDVRALLEKNAARMRALYAGQDASARYEALADAFRGQFGREPELFVSAPGRTEVVGNHTDHQNGKVLAASVNLDTVAAVAPRRDSRVVLYSAGYDVPFDVDIADEAVREEEKETTFALIRGVAARMRQLGYRVGGFDASVTSTVFKGSGLSSSAAFEVMLVAAFDALYNGWTVDAKENARISQYAENVYFGKPSGLLDQSASAVGGLVALDFAENPARAPCILITEPPDVFPCVQLRGNFCKFGKPPVVRGFGDPDAVDKSLRPVIGCELQPRPDRLRLQVDFRTEKKTMVFSSLPLVLRRFDHFSLEVTLSGSKVVFENRIFRLDHRPLVSIERILHRRQRPARNVIQDRFFFLLRNRS